jgi:GNAT superfamily N-acetyltransferase
VESTVYRVAPGAPNLQAGSSRCRAILELSVNDIAIRTARLEEQAALESLQRRASLNNPGDRDALLAHPDAIEVPIDQIADGCVSVAERDGEIAGFASVVSRADGGAELDALFVEPHLWKQGIGRRLVEHVVEVSRARGATFLHVIGNTHAQGFYVSCGFTTSGTIETRFGVGLDMRMPLTSRFSPPPLY